MNTIKKIFISILFFVSSISLAQNAFEPILIGPGVTNLNGMDGKIDIVGSGDIKVTSQIGSKKIQISSTAKGDTVSWDPLLISRQIPIGNLIINGITNNVQIPKELSNFENDIISYTSEDYSDKIKVGNLKIDGTNNFIYIPHLLSDYSNNIVRVEPKINSGTLIGHIFVNNQDFELYSPDSVNVSWAANGDIDQTTVLGTLTINNTETNIYIPKCVRYYEDINNALTAISIGNNENLDPNSFTFNGNEGQYESKGNGTFSINPKDNIEGFYIGESNVYQYVFERMLDMYLSKDYVQSQNVDDLINNEKKLWDLIRDYANYKGLNQQNGKNIREVQDEQIQINFLREGEEEVEDEEFHPLLGQSLNESPTANIFTNSYFNGRSETNNIVAFYPFYKVGEKYLNFGNLYPQGNMTKFGPIKQWTGPANEDPYLPESNSIPEALELPDISTQLYMGLICDNFDPFVGAEKFTIMTWINRRGTSASGASRIIADLTQTTSGDGFQLRFGTTSDGSSLHLFVNPGLSTDGCKSDKLTKNGENVLYPGDTEWHHIAVSYDSTLSSKNVKFFIDGELFQSKNYTSQGSISSNTTAVHIGCSSGGNTWSGQLLGYMDDLILFKDWVPVDYDGEGQNPDVKFWMEMDDAILGKPSLTDIAITFGQFDPKETIYSADQVNKLILNNNLSQAQINNMLGDEPRTFGQFDTTNTFYSSDQIDMLHDAYH